jgi:hypothetical protein
VGRVIIANGRFSGDFAMRRNYSFSGSLMSRTVEALDTNGATLTGTLR